MNSCIQLNQLSTPHTVTASRTRSVSLLEFSRYFFKNTVFARLPTGAAGTPLLVELHVHGLLPTMFCRSHSASENCGDAVP